MPVTIDSNFLELCFKHINGRPELITTNFQWNGNPTFSQITRKAKARNDFIKLLIGTKLDPNYICHGDAANTLRDAFRHDKTYNWRESIFGKNDSTACSFIEITRSTFTSAKWNINAFSIDAVKFFLNGEEIATKDGLITLAEELGLYLELNAIPEEDKRVVIKLPKQHLSELTDTTKEKLKAKIIELLKKNNCEVGSAYSASDIDLKEGCVEATFTVQSDLANVIIEEINSNEGLFGSLGPAIAWIELEAPEFPSANKFREDYDSCESLLDKFRVQSSYWRSILGDDARVVFKNKLEESSLDFGANVLEEVLKNDALQDTFKELILVQFYPANSEKRWLCDNNELCFYPGDKEASGQSFAQDIARRLMYQFRLKQLLDHTIESRLLSPQNLTIGIVETNSDLSPSSGCNGEQIQLDSLTILLETVDPAELMTNILLTTEVTSRWLNFFSFELRTIDVSHRRKTLTKALEQEVQFEALILFNTDEIGLSAPLQALYFEELSSNPHEIWFGTTFLTSEIYVPEWKLTTIGKICWRMIKGDRLCFLILDEAFKEAELTWNLKVINKEGLVDRFGNIQRDENLNAERCKVFLSRYLESDVWGNHLVLFETDRQVVVPAIIVDEFTGKLETITSDFFQCDTKISADAEITSRLHDQFDLFFQVYVALAAPRSV